MWVRAKIQGTKNLPKDSQDIRAGGIIPYGANEFGLDSGLYFELFQNYLNPKNNKLFQRPMYGKKFRKNIHKKGTKTYFIKKKVGHNLVSQMMPLVIIIQ